MELLTFKDWLLENSGDQHSYCCAMLFFSFPELKEEIQSKISTSDVFTKDGDRTYGLEDEPHCTLLYGLHKEVTTEQIEKVTDKFTFYTCKVHNVSKFDNDEYDVLKFEVSGDNLAKCNEELSKLPHTNNFPEYNPHLTIGYLKKGTADKYIKMFKGKEYFLAPQNVVYSKTDGSKDEISIKVD